MTTKLNFGKVRDHIARYRSIVKSYAEGDIVGGFGDLHAEILSIVHITPEESFAIVRLTSMVKKNVLSVESYPFSELHRREALDFCANHMPSQGMAAAWRALRERFPIPEAPEAPDTAKAEEAPRPPVSATRQRARWDQIAARRRETAEQAERWCSAPTEIGSIDAASAPVQNVAAEDAKNAEDAYFAGWERAVAGLALRSNDTSEGRGYRAGLKARAQAQVDAKLIGEGLL